MEKKGRRRILREREKGRGKGMRKGIEERKLSKLKRKLVLEA